MKLLRLKLNAPFRSLQTGFEIYFLRDFDQGKLWNFAPYCLVGRNGSGKSNVLEALAAILYHIECIYLDFKPEGFEGEGDNKSGSANGFSPEKCNPDAFELEYRIPLKDKDQREDKNDVTAHILISKSIGQAPILRCLNKELFEAKDFFKDDTQGVGEGDELSRLGVKRILPDFIVGYSSGENEILSLPFFKMRFIHFDEYKERLQDQTGYAQPEGRLIYIDKQYSQAIMLTNYLMQDEMVLSPIYNTIGIKAITQFRIIINEKLPEIQDLDLGDSDQIPDWTELLKQKDSDSKDLKAIDKLRKCATSCYYNETNHTWYLDYYIDADRRDAQGAILRNEEGELTGLSEMKKAFRAHFNNDPFELFRAFQILFTLNFYDVDDKTKNELYRSDSLYVNETVPVSASHKRVMRFKDFSIQKENIAEEILTKALSDGEHQFLHTIGICLLFRNTNTLFLLDEPETHFNPDWRAKFISTLKNCLQPEKGEPYLRDLLITSHSPFMISDSQEENVLVFKKDPQTGEVSAERPGFKTFGASTNKITVHVFEKRETIGDYAKAELNKLYDSLEAGGDRELLKEQADREFGDSVEKILFLNKVQEMKQ